MPVQPSLLNIKPDHPLIASIPKVEGTSLFNAPVGNPVPKSDVIPAPDYKDPKSRQQYAERFVNKYGPEMHNRADAPLRLNETMDEATGSAKDLSVKAAKPLGIDPALLYSSAMEEGMSGLFKDKNGNSDFSGNAKYPTNGYHNFGLDNISDQVPALIQKGYLPKDFANNFTKHVQVNEKGQKVNSADFKNPDSALQAKAAVMKDAYDKVDEYTKQKGIKLSPQARDFFMLASFNAGNTGARKMLDDYNNAGALKNDAFLKERPRSGPNLKDASWKEPYEHVRPRLLMRDALRKEKQFD